MVSVEGTVVEGDEFVEGCSELELLLISSSDFCKIVTAAVETDERVLPLAEFGEGKVTGEITETLLETCEVLRQIIQEADVVP